MQILDLYHVSEHLVEVAKVRWGNDSSQSSRRQAWVQARLHWLMQECLDDVLSKLDRHVHYAHENDEEAQFHEHQHRENVTHLEALGVRHTTSPELMAA